MDTNNTNNQDNGATPPPKPKSQTKNLIVYFFVVLAGLFVAVAIFNFILPLFMGNKKSFKITGIIPQVKLSLPMQKAPAASSSKIPGVVLPAKKSPVKENKPPVVKQEQGTYVLNGVFFSGNDCYALINNNIVKQGDTVEGALVEKITIDEVDLKAGEKSITLYTYSK